MAAAAAQKKSAQEEIYSQFMNLRNEQRNLVNNLSTLELDLKEHKTVIDTLKTVDENRKCFRLIGGVLAEQTVKDTLPTLIQNRDQLEKLIEKGKEQLTKKGTEINKFKEEHNIKISNESEAPADDSKKGAEMVAAGKGNVLVS